LPQGHIQRRQGSQATQKNEKNSNRTHGPKDIHFLFKYR
jgi:hypothetical protein